MIHQFHHIDKTSTKQLNTSTLMYVLSELWTWIEIANVISWVHTITFHGIPWNFISSFRIPPPFHPTFTHSLPSLSVLLPSPPCLAPSIRPSLPWSPFCPATSRPLSTTILEGEYQGLPVTRLHSHTLPNMDSFHGVWKSFNHKESPQHLGSGWPDRNGPSGMLWWDIHVKSVGHCYFRVMYYLFPKDLTCLYLDFLLTLNVQGAL